MIREGKCLICGDTIKRNGYWATREAINNHIMKKHLEKFKSNRMFNRTIDKQIIQLKKKRRVLYEVR